MDGDQQNTRSGRSGSPAIPAAPLLTRCRSRPKPDKNPSRIADRRETPARSSLVTGNAATSFNQDDVRAKFTGHERDLGLTTSDADDIDYMHARFYNGQIARFLSVDPYEGDAFRPQSLNRYAYVLGSPINLTDPWGLNASACDGMQGPCPQPGYYDEIDVIGHFFDIGPRNGGNWFPWFPSWPAGGEGGGGGGGSIPTISAAPDPQKPATPGGTPKDEAARCNALSKGLTTLGIGASALQYGTGNWTLGSNLKVYLSGWGGNQWVTTARVGSVAFGAGAILAGISAANDWNNPGLSEGKRALNIAVTGIGLFGGPWGAAAAAVYGGVDTYPGGWPAFGKMLATPDRSYFGSNEYYGCPIEFLK